MSASFGGEEKTRVLDSWILLAWLKRQAPGAEIMRSLWREAYAKRVRLVLHCVNLGKIFCLTAKLKNLDAAEMLLQRLQGMPVEIFLCGRIRGRHGDSDWGATGHRRSGNSGSREARPAEIALGRALKTCRRLLVRILVMTHSGLLEPSVFTPNPHLSDAINRNISRSEIEGGVSLYDLPEGATVEIETQNRVYILVSCGEGDALLQGHPTFCPEPVRVRIHGSTWGGAMLKYRFIGRGMHLEFGHPGYNVPILTSRIADVRAIG